MPSKSSGFLMSCFGKKAIPPFGHSTIAFSIGFLARCGAHEMWIWSSFGAPRRVLADLAGALLELAPDHPHLLVGGADRDDPVGELAGLLGVDRAGRRDVDRHRRLGSRVELRALEREVLAVVPDDVAGEQLVDDLDGLEHHRAADRHLRPDPADDVLVERLAGAQAQVEPARIHGPEGRRGMGDDRRVVAEARAGDGGPERQRRPLAERAHEGPGEGARALLRRPRMEVLADHEAGLEAGVLGRGAVVQQVGRLELLEHRRVADLGHRGGVSASGGREGGRRPQAYRVGRTSARPGRASQSAPGSAAMTSISTRISGEASATDPIALDGTGRGRCVARIAPTAGRSAMSVRNTVILTTSPRSAPKCASVVRMFVKTCSVWASIPPATMHRDRVRAGLAGEVEHVARPGSPPPSDAAGRTGGSRSSRLLHLDAFDAGRRP